ncbi:MAG: tetratricopeptide repeat protein [Actinobacteria bacterium]|nr:tetratricopeptide repeat protein [Actinomycetota bacterium]
MELPVQTVRGAGTPLCRARNTVPYGLALAAVAAFSFLSGGYVIGRSTPVVVAFLGAAAVWVWFLRRSSPPSALFIAALAAFGSFVAWSGLSVLWSFGPDLTWVSFNLAAFYLAVAAVLGLTSARGLQLWTVAYGYLAIATAIGVYAFLGKALPAVVTHAHANARLDSPVGYWNVLAVMMVMGLCVALSLAGDRSTPVALRTVAAAAAVPMCLAFFFTFSRGGWLALGVALVLYFAFTTTRLGSFVSLVGIVTPVALVLWRLRDLETLFAATSDDALRALEGGELLRWSLAALLVTAGVQLAAALLQRGVPWPRWSTIAAGAAVLAVVLLVVVGGSARYVQAHGGVSWIEDRAHELFTDAGKEEGRGNEAGRLLVLTTNGRVPLWKEALSQSRSLRLTGSGAGTFPFTHYRFRDGGGVVKHAHGQWFNVLSETGVVGVVLFSVAVVLFVVAMVGNPFSHRCDPLHPMLVALQAGVIAFLVHMSWDWDWDMAAVGATAFVFIAVCVSYRATRRTLERRAARELGGEAAPARAEEPPSGAAQGRPSGAAAEAGTPPLGDAGGAAEGAARPAGEPASAARRGRGSRRWGSAGWAPRVLASAALLVLAASWLPPYLAQRAETAALTAASEGDVAAALDQARRAAAVNPLAVSPLLTEAGLLQQLGRNREAAERLREATRLQPQNYEVWYKLGLLEHAAFGRDKAARAAFSRALALNPKDAASRHELERLAR